MPKRPPSAPTVAQLVPSWLRSLAALNRSKQTLISYDLSLKAFVTFLDQEALPTEVTRITRQHIEAFLADQLAHWKPNTARIRHASLKVFFKWALEEGEIEATPMTHIPPPKVPDDPPAVITDREIELLLKACSGNDYYARRDLALFRLMVDTGLRRGEVMGIKVDDVNWQENTIVVRGKGDFKRTVGFGKKAARDLDRYLRIRATHTHADSPYLWLSQVGKMNPASLRSILMRRIKQAGLTDHIHPHQFRHTFADRFLRAGGRERHLRTLAGWRSDIAYKYARALDAERALAEHREISPGDRI